MEPTIQPTNNQPLPEQPVAPIVSDRQPQPQAVVDPAPVAETAPAVAQPVGPQYMAAPQAIVQPQVAPKKSKLWLWILLSVVVMLVLAGVAVVLMMVLTPKKTVSNIVPASTSQASAVDYPLSSNLVTVSDPAWSFPISVSGWDASVLDQNGVNQLKKQSSQTLFTSYQMLRSGSATTSDADASKKYLDDFITGLSSKAKVSDQKDSTMTFDTFSGKSVEFAVRDYTYTSTAGTYKAKLVTRTTDKHTLTLLYAGLASDVSDTEWQQLTKNVQLEASFK